MTRAYAFSQRLLRSCCVWLALAGVQNSASAGERQLAIELNAAQAVETGCRVSFLIRNAMGSEIGAAVFEVAVIGKDGRVSALIRLDFGRLPENKSRVRQFDLAGKGCGDVGRILLNDVAECSGDGLTPDVCLDALAVSARGDIAFDL